MGFREHPERIRILMLEDSAIDAELIAAQLTATRMRFDIQRVWTRDDFIAALHADASDVILADHVLPGFDGDAALEIAQNLAPHVPFIFVSGTLTEELAVQALRRGARDYVVKQRLQRLGDAIRRAIAESLERAKLEHTQTALRISQERLQLITDSMPVLIAHLDHDLCYQFNNAAYADWFGISAAELRGRHISELAGDSYQELLPYLTRALNGEQVSFETTLGRSGPAPRHVHINYVPERQADGSVAGCYALVRDISDRKAAQLALQRLNESLEEQVSQRTHDLRQSEMRLEAVFQSSFQHQSLIAVDGTLLDTNVASLAVIEATKEQVCGRLFWETAWFSDSAGMPALIQGMVEKAANGSESRQEIELSLPTGRRSFDFSIRPLRSHDGEIVSVVSEAVETTARRQAEEALRQSQKMEAVGQLTGGLAHDFNNLLAAILGNVELIKHKKARGLNDELDRHLEATQLAAKRAASLTQRLLAFSRQQTLDPRPTDVNGLIGGMEEMVRRTIGPSITLEVVGAVGLWSILIDPPQLENALLNLCINARDAMPDGGSIAIETANKSLDQRAAAELDLPAGEYIALCVTDTGTGMTSDVVSHAFEPFFTTKPIGEGTGLGLSMIYGFARQSGGQVRIYSEVGVGTRICIYLPRHEGESVLEAPLIRIPAAPMSGSGKVVLVVDDEEPIRMLICEVLEDAGYSTMECGDSASGLRVLQSATPIDLLITDVGLPGGMNGRQMADAARLHRTDLKVLFITGYAESAVIESGHPESWMQVATKPFTMNALREKINLMMEAPKTH